MDFGGSWEDHLHLVEFAYNNSYHSAIQMAPFEALYGRACRSPTLWDEVGESSVLGPQRIQRDAELVGTIRRRMSEAQDRQKSYADRRRRPLEFSVGDHVFLRVSPTKGVRRFGLKGKLAPRYIGPFQILERIGEVAYRLALPPSLAGVHDVFHVSMLRKYVPHPTHILTDVSITLQPDVTYEEVPVRILDRKERQLRNKTIRLVKVGWGHHSDDEATWELEDEIRAQYPQLFDEGSYSARALKATSFPSHSLRVHSADNPRFPLELTLSADGNQHRRTSPVDRRRFVADRASELLNPLTEVATAERSSESRSARGISGRKELI
ncbi:uncharacterized protein LOC122048067 [Zingiber officinale]|uniref:uncharacterized protein LOC122048067 n=1 Tax=Zingiber officinale TaxID=94328 RepID=UPI001C4C64C0|nr:uncharacterized protein LOC122048067 [Zingiber officinale]